MALTSVPMSSAMAAATAATISGVTEDDPALRRTRQVLPPVRELRELLFSRLFCVPRCS